MPGPAPKNPAVRQRQNQRSTRAVLPAETAPVKGAPKLEPHPLKEKWLPLVSKFWADVWRSPMASEYLEADVHGLFSMAILLQRFYQSPTVQLSAELRQLRMSYGLSPIDRRKLEWTVAQTEEAVQASHQRRARRAVVGNDPREALNA